MPTSDRPEISVIAPVYRNTETLGDLYARLRRVFDARRLGYEMVFVNDACPDGSLHLLQQLARTDPGVTVVALERNVGQQRAVLAGLGHARGSQVVVMDADLQDPPEAIPILLAKLQERYAAVFAGRRGRYESLPRLVTSRVFKWLLHLLCGVPADAGLFVAMNREMVERLLAFGEPRPFIVAMIGCTGLPLASIPVVRGRRPSGSSAYSFWGRFKTGFRAIAWVLSRKLRGSPDDLDEHNRRQRQYFERSVKPTMVPTDSRYLRRHVDQALGFAGTSAHGRVLEVGCGMGRYTLILARRGVRVEGMDLSPVLLDRLRGYNGGHFEIPLHCADAQNPPSELDGSFDLVLGFFVLHHLKDLESFFVAIARLLKPGGQAVFLEPNAYNALFYLQILITPGMTWEGDRGIVQMRPGLIFRSMESAGLRHLAMTRFGFFPPFLANRSLGARLESVLERVPLWGSLLPFQLFRGEKRPLSGV